MCCPTTHAHPCASSSAGRIAPLMCTPTRLPRRRNFPRKEYDKELRNLQIELCKLQAWVRHEGSRPLPNRAREPARLPRRRAAGTIGPREDADLFVETGIQLIKFWLEVGDEEQKCRFEARIEDPLRQWKLSAMDLPSRSKWCDYSRARDQMLEATDTEHAPWDIVRTDDKRRA